VPPAAPISPARSEATHRANCSCWCRGTLYSPICVAADRSGHQVVPRQPLIHREPGVVEMSSSNESFLPPTLLGVIYMSSLPLISRVSDLGMGVFSDLID
jgi:hypothetical protein